MNKKTPRRKISDTNKLHQKIRAERDELERVVSFLKQERYEVVSKLKEDKLKLVEKIEQEKTKVKHEMLGKAIEDKFLQIENQLKCLKVEIVELIKNEV